ncbi:dTDP-4-dehydrorhamnose reductase [Diaphorobacter sp.]|uniref:dTDP-4-dehydrorhamnose reductase n=1 Tax=Diaphorobacter sp. TaxID=1934310 RepID=UPI00258DB2A1|nr:dTDP-4-dehydrorhamnose reductase [Diaphorobacter sp.]
MNILLLGKSGQVGWELQRSLAVLGQVTALGHGEADFTQPQAVAQAVRAQRPHVIVQAAAPTAVDKAESEPERALLLNATTPGVLAEEAARLGAWLVHYSTDYVFDGSGNRPWRETDAPAPLSVYGSTKLEGERLIQQSGCRHLILRTSWVYAARGGNVAKTMLGLAQERERLMVIDDQWGAPTGADLLADVTAHAIRHLQQRPQDGGLYHCVAGGETTWHSYAKYVLEFARQAQPAINIKAKEIAPVSTSAFPTPARRPRNSHLDNARLQAVFGLWLPPWQQGVARMLTEIL